MNTALRVGAERKLLSVEPGLAALLAARVDNAGIEVYGPEMPTLDGSARRWCELIEAAGRDVQAPPRRLITIRRPFEVCHDGCFIRAEAGEGLTFDLSTSQLSAFGMLRWQGEVTAESFRRRSRRRGASGRSATCGASSSAPRWLAASSGRPARAGFGRGRSSPGAATRQASAPTSRIPAAPARSRPRSASPMVDDPGDPRLRGARPGRAVIVVGRHILGGARFPDEPVRHKALDLLGDLALAGRPIAGRVAAHRPSHALAFACVAMLMRSDHWELT